MARLAAETILLRRTSLVVHSGSRHLGMEVTSYYLKEGQKASQKNKQGYASYDMTCLDGELLEHYLHDLEIVQDFARYNREAIIDEIVRGMKWKVLDSDTCIHNYIDFSGETPVLRKGAIQFQNAMEGIHSICINKDTLDESPFAYRKMEEILQVIGETVTVERILKPVYNFKAGAEK